MYSPRFGVRPECERRLVRSAASARNDTVIRYVAAMRRVGALCAAVIAAAVVGAVAHAAPPTPEPGSAAPLSSDVQHLHYKYGPIHVNPGQNLILIGPVTIEKPAYDGFITRMKPDLVRGDGSVPPVDVIHLHHGVLDRKSTRLNSSHVESSYDVF